MWSSVIVSRNATAVSPSVVWASRWQFHKTREDRLRGQRIIHRALFDVEFRHRVPQRDGRFPERSVGVASLPSCRIKRRFEQTIIQQDQAAMGFHAKFCQTDGLGPNIKASETYRCGHRLKLRTPIPKSQTKFQHL